MLKALRFFGWPLLAGVLIALLIIQRYPEWVGLPSLDVGNEEALLAAIGLDTRKVAVERNEEIVPRSTYADVALHEGDRLEIVHFIGGG